MSLSIIMVYLIATVSLSIIPGPNMLLALSNGTSKNNLVILMGIIGADIGNLILITAVSLGLGAMMQASSTLFNLVKWLGTLYLIWLTIELWRHKPDIKKLQLNTNKTIYKAMIRAFVVAISNPKALLFFTAFLPQFIDQGKPQFFQYSLLAIITIFVDTIVMVIYACGGNHAARYLTDIGLRRLNRCCAFIMFSLAVLLAFYKKIN
ncbi:LysE family translocator [Orbus wheelerorum]|uniref:LysE family translocator n=1 Tax=Orbus wheelerorum TaxID=3074111 RepID=UPI00370DABAB